MSETLKRRVINLQVLRAAAALTVVVGHAVHDGAAIAARTPGAALQVLPVDWTFGVDVFFVLSGFIMLHTAAPQFGEKNAWRPFLLRRIARVVPLYWSMTTLLILGAMFVPGLLNVPIGDVGHILASYLFIPDARVTGEIRPVMALGWSLNYEMLFYVLFAASLRLRMAVAVAALSIAFVTLTVFGQVVRPQGDQLAFWTNSIVLEFLFGVYLALAHRAGYRVGAVAAVALLVAGGFGACRFGTELTGIEFAPHCIRNGVPAALIVAAAVLGPSLRSGSRLAIWGSALGAASYSLYLVHPFVIRPLREIWIHTVAGHVAPAAYVGFCLLGSTLTALALFRWVERPLTALCQRLAARVLSRHHGYGRRDNAVEPDAALQDAVGQRALFMPTVSGPTVVGAELP